MIINKVPFKINFPLKILTNKNVNFKDNKEREILFKRHIYYYKYGKIRNNFLEKRNKIFLKLSEEVIKFLRKENHHLNILSLSVFGSSLYSEKPGDVDFLVIVPGNLFDYKETRLAIIKNGKKIKYPVGISIKGLSNFSRGILDNKSRFSLNLQSQIIYRTAISLFHRHLPIRGYDFKDNKKTFLKNVYAQVSDLLNNAYELYYLNNKKLSIKRRSKKILSRIYEATSYLIFLEKDLEIKELRKRIAFQIEKGATLYETKFLFRKVIFIYEKKLKERKYNL